MNLVFINNNVLFKNSYKNVDYFCFQCLYIFKSKMSDYQKQFDEISELIDKKGFDRVFLVSF